MLLQSCAPTNMWSPHAQKAPWDLHKTWLVTQLLGPKPQRQSYTKSSKAVGMLQQTSSYKPTRQNAEQGRPMDTMQQGPAAIPPGTNRKRRTKTRKHTISVSRCTTPQNAQLLHTPEQSPCGRSHLLAKQNGQKPDAAALEPWHSSSSCCYCLAHKHRRVMMRASQHHVRHVPTAASSADRHCQAVTNSAAGC